MLLLTLPITKTELLDLYFLIPEIYLFFSLIFILLHYTIKLVSVIKEYQKMLINRPDIDLTQYDQIIQLFNIGTIIITNKVIRQLKITLFLILCNPFVWTYNKFLFNGFLLNTPYIASVKVVLILLAIVILKTNLFYLRYDGVRSGDISIIFGYIMFSLLIFIQVCDFFVLFLLFEMLALLFYIVLALRQRTPMYSLYINTQNLTKYQKYAYHVGLMFPQSTNTILASFTYFLLNILITGIFLFSLSCLVLIFQATHFVPVIQYLYLYDGITIPVLNIAIFGILIVFLFKLSAAPFHWWIPAVFEGAPLISLMFLAIPFKVAILFVFCKLLFGIIPELNFIWQPLLLLVAILSMFVGSFGLIQQTKIKRFWAYSTVNHMGYILLGLGTDSFLGLRAVFIYFIAYIFMNLAFFILLTSIVNAQLQQRIITLTQFSHIVNFKYTFSAFIFSILIFSLIGIPPLLGFWGKFMILTTCLISLKIKLANFIIIVIIGTSLITTVCYLRIWKNIFIENNSSIPKFSIHPAPLYNLNVLRLLGLLLVFLPISVKIPYFSLIGVMDIFLLSFF
jgi:NADH-quinone oxidoreductase subunit N